jgi:hypothetical protein
MILDELLAGDLAVTSVAKRIVAIVQLHSVRDHVRFHVEFHRLILGFQAEETITFKSLSEMKQLKKLLTEPEVQRIARLSYPSDSQRPTMHNLLPNKKSKKKSGSNAMAMLLEKLPSALKLFIERVKDHLQGAASHGSSDEDERPSGKPEYKADEQNIVVIQAAEPDGEEAPVPSENLHSATNQMDLSCESSVAKFDGAFEYPAAVLHLPTGEEQQVNCGINVKFDKAGLERVIRGIISMTQSEKLVLRVHELLSDTRILFNS